MASTHKRYIPVQKWKGIVKLQTKIDRWITSVPASLADEMMTSPHKRYKRASRIAAVHIKQGAPAGGGSSVCECGTVPQQNRHRGPRCVFCFFSPSRPPLLSSARAGPSTTIRPGRHLRRSPSRRAGCPAAPRRCAGGAGSAALGRDAAAPHTHTARARVAAVPARARHDCAGAAWGGRTC